MQVEPEIAFVAETERPGIEVRVNFGMLAGREATAPEIDELGRMLRPELGDVTIVSETRHEIGPITEAAVHLVRIEVAADEIPAAANHAALSATIVDTARFWARMCVAERPAPL